MPCVIEPSSTQAVATVTATVNLPWVAGSANSSFAIGQATPAITVTPYSVTYDGTAHTAAGAATGVGATDPGLTKAAQADLLAVSDREEGVGRHAAIRHLFGVGTFTGRICQRQVEGGRSSGSFEPLPEEERTCGHRSGQLDHLGTDAERRHHIHLLTVDANREAALCSERRNDPLEQESRERGLCDLALRQLRQAHQTFELCGESLFLLEAMFEAFEQQCVFESVGHLGGGLEDDLVARSSPCGVARGEREEAP